MKQFVHQLWQQDDGVLSFEWVLLGTLIVLGIISGLTGARDAIIDEMGDIAEAVINFDQSYSYPGIPQLGISGGQYTDTVPLFSDCDRAG